MTFEQLRVLQAIVSTGTFRGAAEFLNKSQPAISHMLAKLEDEIGFALFSREGYRPALTEKGTLFYREALRSLDGMQALKETAQNLAGEQEAKVHIAFTATCNLPNFLPAIAKIRNSWPQTDIRLSILPMGGPIEALMQGDADLIIAGLEGTIPSETIADPIGEIRIIPVSHPDYGPATLYPPVGPDLMQQFTQVIVSDSSSEDFQQSRDLQEGNPRWYVSDFLAKKQIIQAGLGWGGLPEHMIEDELTNNQLTALDLTHFPIRETRLYKIRKKDHPMGVVAKSLWETLSPPQARSL